MARLDHTDEGNCGECSATLMSLRCDCGKTPHTAECAWGRGLDEMAEEHDLAMF